VAAAAADLIIWRREMRPSSFSLIVVLLPVGFLALDEASAVPLGK
jgi:hypothetical protein